ncbi:MAG: hypothetical protein HY010_06410 [Acidobacteria bacterium]|nr:hypothetical protein [Acidobacteriota bacterium]
MRVPDYVLKCVGFVGEEGHRDASKVYGDLHGTGFFVSVASRDDRFIHVYFVTAKHIAEELKNVPVYFLVNHVIRGTKVLSGIGDRWWLHPTDSTADLAVTPVNMDSEADFMSINVRDFVTPETTRTGDVWVGDEVFVTGLFTPSPGAKKNMPLVRNGNLAMIPNDQIQTNLGYADVYLIESRSIGGLSGSPAFVRPTIRTHVRENEYGKDVEMLGGSASFKLLGLMHGHWEIEESEINNPQITHVEQRGVNLGIGIVVPAIKIIETLNRPELEKMRNEKDNILMKKNVPGMDSAKKAEEERPQFTKEEFESALKKASRKTDITPKH